MEEKNKRNITIDVLRGIAVIAVIVGHSIQRGIPDIYQSNILFKIIYTFHMPLFMLLSGYTFYKFSKEMNYQSLLKKFLRLIIPTFVWNYIIYFARNFNFVGIKEFIYFPNSVIQYSKDLIMNPTYIIWFLYTVFFCMLILFFQNRILKNTKIGYKICITILISILINIIPIDNFGISYIKYYFPIFSFGYYLNIVFEKIKKYIKYLVLPSIICYILLLNIYNYGYSSIIINYSISLFAIIIIYYLVSLIKNKKVLNIFQYFGKRSLEFYLCQCLCLNIGFGVGKIRILN